MTAPAYFAPVKASNGFHFYVYDELPGLVSRYQLSARLSREAFERVALLLNDDRPGYELVQQNWDAHLRDGHERIELHTIRPRTELKDEHRLLKVQRQANWPPGWLDALHYIENEAVIHE